MKGENGWQEERGTSFLECLTALPLLAIVFTAFALLLTSVTKDIVCLLADWELQQEICLVTQRLERCLASADKVEFYGTGGQTISIRCREPGNPQRERWYTYTVKQSTYQPARVTENTQPLTGDSSLGQTEITAFDCHYDGKGVFAIRVAGKSRVSKHDFALETACLVTDEVRDFYEKQ